MSRTPAEIVAQCQNLPTIPAIALEVLRLSREENIDLKEIAGVIARDVALSGRILSVVNSAYYGLPRKVSTIGQAVVMLGMASVKTLALGFSLADTITSRGTAAGDLTSFWRRSLHMAVAARTFAARKIPILREEAFTAGLLADVGVMAMHDAFKRDYADLCAAPGCSHAGIVAVERERFGVDHQQLSLAMTEAWHLPELLTLPIGHHHDSETVGGADAMLTSLADVLRVATLCADVFCTEAQGDQIKAFETAAEACLGLDSESCRSLVVNLHADIQEVAKVLDIQIPESLSYAQIVQQANQELTRLNLQAQQRMHEAERSQREASERLEVLEESNRQLAQKANTDPLTGVYNRRFMEGFLEREIARAARFRRPLSVLFIDVDHFKQINDSHGHLVGDAILRQLAKLLGAATRDVDCLCRYGGEEFMLTLLETELWGATQLAEKIRRLVAAWKFKSDGQETPYHVTVSIGVAAMNPNRPVDKELLIQMADESAYAAKRDGRNCVCALRKRVSPLPETETPAASSASAGDARRR
ncbi:MAG TPA: GGDEF domain-containing protein [Phycisphaerae bacterium]|nr:GGDEF domain-containing protein [Phycisphaerae bacterium]HOI54423.1 GGDEF domain-containing protein [Phycisphaerae bacterium]